MAYFYNLKMEKALSSEVSKYTSSQITQCMSRSFSRTFSYSLTPWSRVLLEKLTGSQLAKKFPAFLKPKCSLPHLQVPATCPYPGPDRSSPCPTSHFLKIHLIIILPYMSRSPKWSLSLRFPHQNLMHTSPFLHTCCMSSISNISRFDHPNKVWRGVQIIKLLIM